MAKNIIYFIIDLKIITCLIIVHVWTPNFEGEKKKNMVVDEIMSYKYFLYSNM